MTIKRYTDTESQTALHSLNSKSTHAWHIEDGQLTKTYQFADFIHAFGFMSSAALVIEKHNHHPDWRNVYKTVTVQLTTHEVDGLSERDFDLAHELDRLAGERR
ncbi:4a-hydroxytetrahydrobiopterin dehydratase [Saccharospirillum mangrovi]|uniref:4a-hydroxytetrahydrobiopterin dehydratase n=1 Tax=Saccharospirillum mangrovi TaxID=2161747 RepID=UPI000D3747AD|nr:4a-hydroxytetrahydrobiopterin dehydratase [Saccharospirillum mangrovi]